MSGSGRGTALWITVAGFLLICLCAVGFIAMRNYQSARALIIAEPPSSLLQNPAQAQLDLQAVSLLSHGGRVVGWYIPSKNRAAVIVTGGTNSDRASMLPEMRVLAAAGFGVLAIDWPGLGESGGPVRWGGEAKDALRAAADWLASRQDVDPARIGALGFSMGGFILAQVAAKDDRLRAVVLESSPTNFEDYLAVHNAKWGVLSEWPARWALRDSGLLSGGESALSAIAAIAPRALLIIGQTDDPEIPAPMTQALDRAARAPKQLWLLEGAQHGGYEAVAGAEYSKRLQTFFEESLLPAR